MSGLCSPICKMGASSRVIFQALALDLGVRWWQCGLREQSIRGSLGSGVWMALEDGILWLRPSHLLGQVA